MSYTGGPMTEAMYYVLLTLMYPNHGYQLMQEISEISGGRVKMGPGTLYGLLNRIEEEGLIAKESDDGRRKTYRITLYGKEQLYKEYERLNRMISDGKIIGDWRPGSVK
ncbi:MAG TPA: PadR family transcriptional regulator [Clostridiaceae bacterium]|nr:PadR family transcriptional regulator [Clostridiaceae bacterium]